MKKIIVSILGLSVIGLAQANEKTGDLKSSANINATCLISASPIGFGAIATPLLAQSAQSEMNVKCSNASAYTIDLAYGGVYGSGSSNGGTVSYQGEDPMYKTTYYTIENNTGGYVGYMACTYGGPNAGKVYFENTTTANKYGVSIAGWQPNNGACITNGTQNGTYPNGWTGSYKDSGKQSIGAPAYAYGVMQGSFKGDKLAYSIAVPSDSSKVWNAGNNSYKSTGNGDNQTIPLNAKIVPDKSDSKYPAPDMYLDTVTAVISY